MARIRSVHPSLFTDEAWVSCSPLARVLYIGLMTDADDQGLFEWKPLQIRMRLLPGDNADVPALLGELAEANLIAQVNSGGKNLGAIRKFRRFQKPKKPNSVFVLPVDWRTYVGLSDDGSELDGDEDDDGSEPATRKPASVPKKGENLRQMEDGGGSKEESPQKPPLGAFSPEFLQAWGGYPEDGRSTSNREVSFAAWAPEAERVGAAALGACVRAFAASLKARGPKAKAAPKFHVWLKERRYEAFLGDTPKGQPSSWAGPADVFDAVKRHKGAEWAVFHLSKCRWDADGRTLIAPTVQEMMLRQEAEGSLGAIGVRIITESGRAA